MAPARSTVRGVPLEPPPSAWEFPPVARATGDGLLAVGADLEPGTLLAAYGIDPQTWQLVTFTLHSDHPADVPGDVATFQVLHVSAPEHHRLPRRVDTRMAVPR
jgi:hypothetical protein